MMRAAEAAALLNGRLSGGDVPFTAVSTDSRHIGRGELFVALRGERFDGHEFLGGAASRGAAAAIIDRNYSGAFPLPVVIVDDTKRALGELARRWRERFAPALIAVTGSNGKTTVKEMVAAILRRHAGDASVLATSGNFNNDIGVPLTLLRLRAEHRWCAIELGMNHRGEIAYLSKLAAPMPAAWAHAAAANALRTLCRPGIASVAAASPSGVRSRRSLERSFIVYPPLTAALPRPKSTTRRLPARLRK